MTEPLHPTTAAAAARFAPTHWSAVLRAGDQNSRFATDALEELCRVYWFPLYAFARRRDRCPVGCRFRQSQQPARLAVAIGLASWREKAQLDVAAMRQILKRERGEARK